MRHALFKGGPLDGRELAFARWPHYLRAVIGLDGTPDVLDQLDDEPALGDVISVYRMTGHGHVSMHPRSKSYSIAWYEHMPVVDAEAVRDTEGWRAWAEAQAPFD
jgi:hypothetical protein